MKTMKTKSLDQMLVIAKPFVGSLSGKYATRPVLKTALVNEKHITVTDSCILLRMEHNHDVSEAFLHHYKEDFSQNCEAKRYPDVSRIIPQEYDAKLSTNINIDEWIIAHELSLPSAKHHKNNVITLTNNVLTVSPGEKNEEYKCYLNQDTNIETIHYNCKYMIMMLKAFKKMWHKEATLHFYDKLRPMLLTAEGIEGILLPIRKY